MSCKLELKKYYKDWVKKVWRLELKADRRHVGRPRKTWLENADMTELDIEMTSMTGRNRDGML